MFIVTIKKHPNKNAFCIIKSDYNKSFIDLIKSLEKEKREFIPKNNTWVVHIFEVFKFLQRFQNSQKISFQFESEEDKNYFFYRAKQLYQKELKKVDEKNKNLERIDYLLSVRKNISEYSNKVRNEIYTYLNPKIKPYDYQYDAIAFINEAKSALLSLDMGLGKTMISIIHCEMMGYKKIFVITPKSLKYNFYNEVLKFTKSKAYLLGNKNNLYTYDESKYVIINYDFFRASVMNKTELSKIKLKDFDCLLCDEAHRINNKKTNTSRNIFTTFKHVKNNLFLTGTPAPNRLRELFSILQIIDSITFSSKDRFYTDYCGLEAESNGFGTEYVLKNPDKIDEFFDKTIQYIYRKRKEDVLNDLPDKIIQIIPLELSSQHQRIYDNLIAGTNEVGDNIYNEIYLEKLINARKFLSKIKVEYMDEIISDLLYENKKIVFIDYFLDTLFALKDQYNDISELFYGKLSDFERNELILKFQDKESSFRLFLGQETATKEGLTLTASSDMILNTLPYSYGVFDQIIGRCHRIGQKNSVNIKCPIFKNTVDETFLLNLKTKAQEIHKGLDGKEIIVIE